MTDLLDLTRRVTRPSLIYTAGGQAHLEACEDLAAIAARLRALNPPLNSGAARFEVSERAWPGAYPGLDLFHSWSVYVAGDWTAAVLLPPPRDRDPATRAALVAALAAPAARRAAA